MQVKGTLMNQTLENGKKKLISSPTLVHFAQTWAFNLFIYLLYFFLWVLSLLDVRHCHKL